jgi:C1A family cysteine protease
MPLHVHPAGHGYGWRRSLPNHRFPRRLALVEAAALPPLVDLRPQMPAVYDQGQLGSCTANAWAGLVEYLQMRQGLAAFVPSRLQIYYDERAIDGDTADDTGAACADGAQVVSKQGTAPESDWPYDTNKFAEAPPGQVVADALTHLTFNPQSVAQDLTTMKETLAQNLPIVVGFTVFESFESDAVAKSGVMPMPAPSEQQVGGHAVLVVGYDDSKSVFIMRNSWGADWGISGAFLMPYAYLTNPQLADDFWTATRTE